jgi:iron complex transport system substrate-binding protein
MRRYLLLLSVLLLRAWPGHAAEPHRVVAAGGALTEIVYALGLGADLVGADSTSGYPQEAERLPRIGYVRSLGAEGLLALRPTLLLAGGEAGPPSVLNQIRAAGVHVEVINAPNSPAGVEEKIKGVARVLGVSLQGDALIARFHDQWRDAIETVARFSDRPRVLFVMAHGGTGFMAAGRKTAADAVIGLAGGVNAAGAFEGYKPLTSEAAITAMPDLLLVTRDGAESRPDLESLWENPALALTPAGKSRRAVVMDTLFLLGFGPRLPEAVTYLAQAMRGKAPS